MNIRSAITAVGQRIVNLVPRHKPAGNFSYGFTRAPTHMTHDLSLQLAAVNACQRIISGTLASLGWHVLSAKPDGSKSRERSGTLNWILNVQANPETTAFVWRELAAAQALMLGNHYSEIQRDTAGRPLWVWQLDPGSVTPDRRKNGNLFYRARGSNGEVELEPEDMLHVKGLGADGMVGYSVLSMAARSLGFAWEMDLYGASFFANGTHLGLVMEHPNKLSPDAKTNLLDSLNAKHTGGARAFRAIVAEEGMKLNRASMTMVDAQFNDLRKFQALDICRWFGVPPHKMADLSQAHFANVENLNIEFVQDTIVSWCKRFEQEVDIKLIGARRQGRTYTRLNIDTLLRGDTAARHNAYTAGRNGGWYSVNDIRALEGLDGIGSDGDVYLQPLNMAPAGTPSPEPKPAPVPNSEGIEALRRDFYHVKDIVVTASSANKGTSVTLSEGAIQLHHHAAPLTFHVPQGESIINVEAPNITMPEREVRIEAPINVTVPERAVNVAAPTVNVTVPEQTINVNTPDVHVAAPNVTVEPPVVNVEAPTVHVAAPTVNVASPSAPIVNVDAPVTVNVPKAKPRKITFEEDANGNITGAALTNG